MMPLLLTAALAAANLQARSTMEHDLIRFQALSLIESGDDDRKVGTHGEVSRFQILPREWALQTDRPISLAHHSDFSFGVAVEIMRSREARFRQLWAREPSDREWALLWHCPRHAFAAATQKHRLNREQLDYIDRFANTVESLVSRTGK